MILVIEGFPAFLSVHCMFLLVIGRSMFALEDPFGLFVVIRVIQPDNCFVSSAKHVL